MKHLTDVECARTITLSVAEDGKTVFVMGPRDFCFEVDRTVFVAQMCELFDLVPAAMLPQRAITV